MLICNKPTGPLPPASRPPPGAPSAACQAARLDIREGPSYKPAASTGAPTDSAMLAIATALMLLPCVSFGHMPTFVSYDSCWFEDEASSQSMALYMKIPSMSVARCSFVINDANEELKLSVNMPVSHYDKVAADNLGISIYAPDDIGWTPRCKTGWSGWHGDSASMSAVGDNDQSRTSLSNSGSDRRAVFEPWGIGGYVPIIACSTPIASTGVRHFISINNTNTDQVRVSIGVGIKEEHFKSPVTWIKMKWLLWLTWEWGLTSGAFYTVVSFATLINIYIVLILAYGETPGWLCWIFHAMRSGPEPDEHVNSDSNDTIGEGAGDKMGYDDAHQGLEGAERLSDINPCDIADSDKIVHAAGCIVLFWTSGMAVVWLVVFFINRADVSGNHTDGPKLIRWENVWSALIYVYTLPVIVVATLYILLRYSILWQWFWFKSTAWHPTVVMSFLFLDILIATAFDLVYPFSPISSIVCLYCIIRYASFLDSSRRFCPTIPGLDNEQCTVRGFKRVHQNKPPVKKQQRRVDKKAKENSDSNENRQQTIIISGTTLKGSSVALGWKL